MCVGTAPVFSGSPEADAAKVSSTSSDLPVASCGPLTAEICISAPEEFHSLELWTVNLPVHPAGEGAEELTRLGTAHL